MQPKSLLYSLMLCLVFLTASACSPAAGPNPSARTEGTTTQGSDYLRSRGMDYTSPAGPYDDDRGFKSDFQRSDLNPNMVTGRNDLFNTKDDAQILASLAATVKGVDHARVNINGGTAHVTVDINNATDRDVQKIISRVYNKLKSKMPRYLIDVQAR